MDVSPISEELAQTLESTARLLNAEQVQWMVFGGAAMTLLGYETGGVRDIDIIVTAQDAEALSSRFSWRNYADLSSARFRSDYVLRPHFGPIPIEIMGGFRIQTGGAWTNVAPIDRSELRLGSEFIFLPAKSRLIEIFRLCGRAKDLNRAALLSGSADNR